MSTHRLPAPPPAPGWYKASYSQPCACDPGPADRSGPHFLTPTVPWSGKSGGNCAQADSQLPLPADPQPPAATAAAAGRNKPNKIRQKPSGQVAEASAPPHPDLSSPGVPGRRAISGQCASPWPPTHRCRAGCRGVGVRASGGVCLCLGGVLLGNCCSRYHGGSGGIARQFAVPALIALNSSVLRG